MAHRWAACRLTLAATCMQAEVCHLPAETTSLQARLRGSRSLKREMSRVLHKYEREGSGDRELTAPLFSR